MEASAANKNIWRYPCVHSSGGRHIMLISFRRADIDVTGVFLWGVQDDLSPLQLSVFFPGCLCLGLLVFNVWLFFCSRQCGSAFITTWLWPPNFFIQAKCQRTAPMVLEISYWTPLQAIEEWWQRSDDEDDNKDWNRGVKLSKRQCEIKYIRCNIFSLMAWSIGCSSEMAVWAVGKKERTSSLRLTHVSARRGEVPSTGAVNKKIISIIFVG